MVQISKRIRIDGFKKYVSDFETTTYRGQTSTEVWASALCPLSRKDSQVIIHDSIEKWWYYLILKNEDMVVYFHNLRFDGQFILYYLFHSLGFKAAIKNNVQAVPEEMENGTVTTLISSRNQWYQIIVKDNDHYIVFRDSLKLLPFTVAQIAGAFGLPMSKGEIDYTKHRKSGEPITEEEKDYIKRDVLIVRDGLLYLKDYKITTLTIGSAALTKFRNGYHRQTYNDFFPEDIYQREIDASYSEHTFFKDPFHDFGSATESEYIRKAYRGGWCYVKPDRKNKIIEGGCTADVNSLYPSMMLDRDYPVDKGYFFVFTDNPEKDLDRFLTGDKKNYFLFLRFKCRFYLKKGYLPFFQIKNNPLYPAHTCLTTSAFYDRKTKKYYSSYLDENNQVKNCDVEITMTLDEFLLFRKHYHLYDLEFLDGCYYEKWSGERLFGGYVKKYRDMKINAKNKVEKQVAKLMQNSLYGKFSASEDSSFKYPVYDYASDLMKYITVLENDKKPGYIPIGAAITAHARIFTISAAQKNYDSFCYADTDSIHCACKPEEIKGITIHDKNFSCWKIESVWDKGLFVRQKTYIESWIEKDEKGNDERIYDIKCAGMNEKCKNQLRKRFRRGVPLTTFKVGLKVRNGRLIPRPIPGGVVLVKTTFEIKKNIFF